MNKDKLIGLAWKCIGTLLIALSMMTCTVIPLASAQGVRSAAKNQVATLAQPVPTATENEALQGVLTSLASLPEADTLIYISPHRIIADAAPRVLPDKDLAEMREGISKMKTDMGIDPASIDYIVLQMRFKKPTAELNFSLPEFMLVASGGFKAEALMAFAEEAGKGNGRTENYGSRKLTLITIDDVAKEAEKTPLLKSLSEVAVVMLNDNTIAVGTPAYVKAAIDAGEGKGRISSDLLNSVMRDPTALASAAGSPWNAFAKTFALLGTENNPRAPKCDSKLGDYYAAITTDGTSFRLRGAMNADNPDTAKIIKSLLSSLLQQATGLTTDKNAVAVLSSLVITPTETEVLVQADVSQQAVADFIREQTAPKKPEVTTPAKPKPKRHRRPRHRARR